MRLVEQIANATNVPLDNTQIKLDKLNANRVKSGKYRFQYLLDVSTIRVLLVKDCKMIPLMVNDARYALTVSLLQAGSMQLVHVLQVQAAIYLIQVFVARQ